MPNRPEDDWTRPLPRTPRPERRPDQADRGGRDGWGGGGGQGARDGQGASSRPTERIPRQQPPQRPASRATDPRYDEPRDREARDPRAAGPRYAEPGHAAPRAADPRRGYQDPQGAGLPPQGPPPRSTGSTRAPLPPRRRRRYALRRVLALLLLLVVLWVVSLAVVAALVWGSIGRVDSSPDVSDRPGGASGENYLLVGTDSRAHLNAQQRREYGTGQAEGSRADTVMLLHVPTLGEPTLVSLPRDSYVQIRGHGYDKLNAAHSIGGPALLVDTVEQATKLPISGYLEIGFGGFVNVVQEVGGVRMCLDHAVKDQKAHIDLPAGCQELTGPEALGYVRMRYSDPRGDLGRVERQRQFLGALVGRMASPATVLNPWRFYQVGTATGHALTIGDDTSMLESARIGWAMRAVAADRGVSLTVPVANPNYMTNAGSTVLWDEAAATRLFTALRNGDPVTVQP